MTLAEFPATVSVKRKFAASPVRAVRSRADCEVAVIGAGPYGLAVAAHLRGAGIDTRVFGEAMGFWQRNMPKGMKLRSPWSASYIADPSGELTLDAYTKAKGVKPVQPFPLEDFVRYGQWFQQKVAPDLDTRRVELVDGVADGFVLKLEDGERVIARRVVIALGLANQEFKPAEFAGMSADLVSHSSAHDGFERFRNRRVAVVGRGQSACESAVLLSEAGAEVELISRGDVRWIGSENPDTDGGKELVWSIHKVLTSTGAVGPFPLNWLVDMPAIVRHLPAKVRDRLAERCLRPAATAWLKPRAAKGPDQCRRHHRGVRTPKEAGSRSGSTMASKGCSTMCCLRPATGSISRSSESSPLRCSARSTAAADTRCFRPGSKPRCQDCISPDRARSRASGR